MSCLSHARIYRKVSLTDLSGFILHCVVSLVNNFWYLQKNKGIFHSGTICENLNFGIFDLRRGKYSADNLYPIHTARPDPTKQSCLCRVCLGGVNGILDNSRLSPTENLKSEHVNSSCLIHTATPDTTQTGLFCRVWQAV